MRPVLIWSIVTLAIAVPLIAAGMSPLLAWRDPIYIVAGFAGVLGLGLMLLQPLLAGGLLPGLAPLAARRTHRAIGALLMLCVVLHILGLWITSPPDVIDVLLFRSPTPFALWGVIAMWAVFAAALLALFRRRLRWRPRTWRLAHTAMAALTVGGTVGHALLIDGTMEWFSKLVLCVLVLSASGAVFARMRL